MSDRALIVMAAGIGSRYGGLKQIEPIGPSGEIILDYSVYDALRSGFGKIILVINRKSEHDFRERVEQSIGKHCEILYVYQDLENLPRGYRVPDGRVKPWGTAHAVLSCKDVVDTPFAVINADDFYGLHAFQSLAEFLQHIEPEGTRYLYSMVGYQLVNTITEHGYVSRGICSVDINGYLLGVRERTHIEKNGDQIRYTEDGENWVVIPGESVASMNIWGFTPDLFLELDMRFNRFLDANHENQVKAEYFLPEVINELLAEEKAAVKVLHTDSRWFGVTYKEDVGMVKEAIKNMIDQGDYPVKLWG